MVWGGLLVLLFFGALFWAWAQDPFSRHWFTLKTSDYGSFDCVTVLPKPIRQRPAILYAHGSGGNLMNDGNDLRQMAELGLGVLSLEYNQTNAAAFEEQFAAALQYLRKQPWANTNALAWIGFSLGANASLDYACQHPEQQPNLLVQLSGAGLAAGQTNNRLRSLHGPVLLVHGKEDQVFPVADTERLASILQSNGVPAELRIIPGVPHGMEPDRGVVFRSLGESCLTQLQGQDAWPNYHSIAQWQTEAPALWLFWIPAAAWAVAWFAWSRYRQIGSSEKIELSRGQAALWWAAVLLALCALADTVLHLGPPRYPVSDETLSLARKYLVQPKEMADFEYLASKPIWEDDKLKTLLEHVELACYNRELINWQLDEKSYQDFVLSPGISGSVGEQLNWRRPLWEEFYPRIRHESTPEDAARIVARHLRERVTIARLTNLPHDVPKIWLRQITDPAGFEIIYVAALRSVGVPARLTTERKAEFWDGKNWLAAPRPVLEAWP